VKVNDDDKMKMIPSTIPTVASLFLFSFLQAANAQNSGLSAVCTSQNEALAANAAVLAAIPKLLCEINLDVADSCTVDFETVSDNFKDTCFNEGGKIYQVDLFADCTIDPYSIGITYNADYLYLNYPSCVGINCTAEELDVAWMNVLHPTFEQQLADQGFVCDVSDSNEEFDVESGGGSLFYSGTTTLMLASVMVASAVMAF
jgi:hypothetical protein